jgi:hypothetical protein
VKTYIATFEYTGGADKKVLTPASYTVLGYGVKIHGSYYKNKMFYVEFSLLTPADSNIQQIPMQDSAQVAPLVALPIAGIAVGILVVAGLVAAYYNFKEVHEIIESPQGSFLALGIVAIIGVILWKLVKW